MRGGKRHRCSRGASLGLLALAAAGCLAAPAGTSDEADAAAGEPDAAGPIDRIDRIDRDSAPREPIPDDDQDGVSDSIAADVECTVDMLTVDVEIRHPWRSDLEVTLHSPGGGKARLHTAAGTDPQDDLVGTYAVTLSPDDSLEAFVGLPATGSWVMQVADLSSDDIGTFESWALHIECR